MQTMETHPLKRFRVAKRLTQVELARLLDVSGMTVSRWEAGTRRIDDELLPRISQRTGIPRAVLRPDLARLLQLSEPEAEAAAP